MESYVKVQADTKSKIIKGAANFKKTPKERLTQSYIETRLETLEKLWSSFDDTHRAIVSEASDEEFKKSTYNTSEVYDATEESYIIYKSDLREALFKIKSKSCKPVESNESKVGQSLTVNLPKISIPMFSGKYAEWISFRDLFLSLIHNSEGLDDVQKLHYLKSHLCGEAEQLLRHVPITACNYKVCWSQLESRYNNKRYLANCILKRLMSQKNVVTESSNSIKDLLDTTNECLNALKNLKIDVSSWDIIVIYIISLKLDNESRKLWEVQVSNLGDKLPTWSNFHDFLDQRFRSLEFLDSKNVKYTVRSSSNPKTMHVITPVSCVLCKDNHKLCSCKQFVNQDTNTRREFVKTNRLCFNCLNSGHSVQSCRQSTSCRICRKKHHSLLHPKSVSKTDLANGDQSGNNSVALNATTSSQGEFPNITTCLSNSTSQVLLATALVQVETKTGTIVLRSLLDQGSQASFITESAVQLLGLKKIPYNSNISGLGSDQSTTLQSKWIVSIKIQSRHNPKFTVHVKAHVLSKITSLLPERKMIMKVLSHLPSLELADPFFDKPNKVDLLLGAEVYALVLSEGLIKGPPGYPIAQNTNLGWILSGQVHTNNHNSKEFNKNIVSAHTMVSDNDLLRSFWELEEVSSSKKILSEEEMLCEQFYSQTTCRDEFGRYIVKLPFRSDDPKCQYGNSFEVALKRLQLLEKRFHNNPEFESQYSEVIQEYLHLGHMEVVPDSEKDCSTAVYLPHHAVIRNDKTTSKVRVVFDASCLLNNGTSLNNDLMVGPTLQPDLKNIIMRWRCHPISLVADIIKMYRQVKVGDDNINFQRLLWRDKETMKVEHLRLLRVTFGTSSAPFLAVRSLQQLAHDNGNLYPLAKDRIIKDFYMDDLMTGCESVEEGIQIYHEMKKLMRHGCFELQKWASSNPTLLEELEGSEQAAKNSIQLKTDNITKILGLYWNKTNDEFSYTVQLPPLKTPVTKRQVISDIAKLFDPLGWIAPVITTAKIFIQRIWLSGVNWDDEIPSSILSDWITYRNDLPNVSNFTLPRWVGTRRNDISVELQGFCDASNAAYAAVVYIRVVDCDKNVHVALIASRTRVAPVKQVSIPRLELCGAVLLTKLLHEVSETLAVPLEQVHAWTDSQVVLAWLRSHPSKWKTFVANRVSEIITFMDSSHWSFVQSKDNPADCASRGLFASELSSQELWRCGPCWLQERNIIYNKGERKETNLEEKKEKVLCHAIVSEKEEENSIISRFSSLNRLIRVLAYCKRFVNINKKDSKITRWLTTKEINEALLTCIRICQNEHFLKEIYSLKKCESINKNSKLTSLNPFLDADNILRVGGRIHNANVDEDMKHPIILPHKSHLTRLIVADVHKRTIHGGPQIMLSCLRTKYWVINAKIVIKQHVRKCVTCIRHSAQTRQQMMGRLPAARVTACRPFYQSGVDYAGPISIRTTKGRGCRSTKGYICLFVCMATRAVHLEVVSDLTSSGFLAAFKRFVARRGHCKDMWSDNATTFVGADRELKFLFNAERSSIAHEIAESLATNGTNWHFIPPHSPNFGGLWESGIKSSKHHLRRVLGTTTLTFEEMTTLLAQIEACLNSRPISQVSNNPEDAYPLTPAHFLVGEPLILVPDLNFENSNISTLQRWNFTQRLLQDFWRRWSQEYLTQLHHRYKWSSQTLEPNVGDVVLVKADDLPPARWLYGIISEKHVGSDNLTRVVSVRCKGSTIKRPLSKLIILPVTT